MFELIKTIIDKVADEGARKFARWDGNLFQAYAGGMAMSLWYSIQSQPNALIVTEAYLRLICEAIGGGYLQELNWRNPHRSFLEFFLVDFAPRALNEVDAENQIEMLAKAWNIGEGLQSQPRWLDGFVTSQTKKLASFAQLEKWATKTLNTALAAAEPAKWQGPFKISMLCTRKILDE